MRRLRLRFWLTVLDLLLLSPWRHERAGDAEWDLHRDEYLADIRAAGDARGTW